MTFLDSWNISSGYVIYRIKLVVYSAKIEGIHLVTVETSNQIIKQKIKMSSSLVFQDTNRNIFTELYKVLDKNYSSCICPPVLENTPPLLLMKLNTACLKISYATYNVTIIGEYISCQTHGQRSLQVGKIYN